MSGKKEEQKLVPQLRFPEFRDAESWSMETLGDIYSFKITNSFSRENLNYNEGLVKNIHYGDIHTKFAPLFDITQEKVPFINPSISIEKIKSECYCVEGDMVFADASEDIEDVGKSIEIVQLNSEKLLAGLHTLLARQKEIKLIVGFGGHLFKINNIRSQIHREAHGAKVLGISAGRLSSIRIFYPQNKDEQQKIADCLTSLDDLITAQSQKIDILKTHKKGLIQQLFPSEGETVPNYRFPEFRNTDEWQLCQIGTKIDFFSGYPFKSTEISENSNGTRLLRGINITEGKLRHSQDIDRYYLGDINKLTKYKVQVNDLVIGMDGSKVGKNSALITSADGGALLVQRVARLRSEDKTTIQFIYQQINSIRFHSYVDRINTSSGIPHISSEQIKGFSIHFPPACEEQQKVTDCLSSIDALIDAQSQKIDTLKAHKKGLMQQLFPSIT